jgi:hypothetical protein
VLGFTEPGYMRRDRDLRENGLNPRMPVRPSLTQRSSSPRIQGPNKSSSPRTCYIEGKGPRGKIANRKLTWLKELITATLASNSRHPAFCHTRRVAVLLIKLEGVDVTVSTCVLTTAVGRREAFVLKESSKLHCSDTRTKFCPECLE